MRDDQPVVEGYCAQLSYEPGERVAVHCGAVIPNALGFVNVAPTALVFSIEVARIGKDREIVHRIDGLSAEPHPIPEDAAARGPRWPETTSFVTGSNWRSGWYELAMIARAADGSESVRRAGFALRARRGQPTAKMLLVLATNTWNAYNDWGGANLYTTGTHVSFRRPLAHGLLDRPEATIYRNANIFDEPDAGHEKWMEYWRTHQVTPWAACAGWPSWEKLFVEWAERNGYALDYAINSDLVDHPDLISSYPLMLSVGHDEYWSYEMRDTVENFVARGGHVAFFSGNTSFWQVRLEDGGDTMVSYKGVARKHDPFAKTDPSRLTSLWSDPRIGRPETHMTGVTFSRGGYARVGGGTPRGQRGYTVWRPEHWLFEGTDLRYGDLLGARSTVVGYECDGCAMTLEHGIPVPTGEDGCPAGFTILASAPARIWSVDATTNEYPAGLAPGRPIGELQGVAYVLFGDMSPESCRRVAHGHAVLGTYTAGGTVVTSGCTDWAYGLTGDDPLVERITRNVLDRLAV